MGGMQTERSEVRKKIVASRRRGGVSPPGLLVQAWRVSSSRGPNPVRVGRFKPSSRALPGLRLKFSFSPYGFVRFVGSSL